MTKLTYAQKLRDPRWQKKRLEIFERDQWACTSCGDSTTELQVHHLKYINGKDPWEYENGNLQTLCSDCHEETHFPNRKKSKPLEAIKRQLPFDLQEADLLKLLLLYGDLSIAPQISNVSRKYSKLYELIISEFVRHQVEFKSETLKEIFDAIAFKFYNEPGFLPDVEVYLTSTIEKISAFSSYIVESEVRISPNWARMGLVDESKRISEAKISAIKLTYYFVQEKVGQHYSKEQDKLKSASNDESAVLEELIRLNKLKSEIEDEKNKWV